MKTVSFVRLSLIAVLVMGCVVTAGESPTGSGKPLHLADAVALTLARSPVLASRPSALRAADARRAQALVRPPLELSLDIEDIAGSGQYQGFRTSQNTLTLSHVFELGGKRAALAGVAGAQRLRLDDDYMLARAEVLAGVTEAFIHVVGDQHGLAWSRDAVRLAEQSLSAIQQRVQAAAGSPLDEKRARITLARARIVEDHEKRELESARRRLAALWGDTEANFSEAVADLFARPAVPDYDALVSRITRSPELIRWASEKTVRAAELRLAESRRRPDLTAALGLRHYSSSDDAGMVLQLSRPLGTRSRAAGFEAEARALREQADAGERETEIRLRTALFGIAQELRHARTELGALETEILPEAEAALKLARDGVARARYSQLDLLDTRRTLLELRHERIEAAIAFHQFVVQIEKILGEPLSPGSAPMPKTPQP